MKFLVQNLGKVSITCNGDWENKEYDRLCLVNDGLYATYLSKKPVPKGITLNNRNYWQPVAIFNKEFQDKITNDILIFQEYIRDIILEHKEEVSEIIAEHKKDVDEAMAAHKSEVSKIISDFKNEVTEEINDFENSVNTTISNHKKETTNIINQHKTETTNIINAHKQEVSNELSDMNEEIDDFETSVNNKISTHETTVQNYIKAHENTVNTQVNNLQTQISKNAGDIASNDTDIKNLQDDLAELNNDLNSVDYTIVKKSELVYELHDKDDNVKGTINIPQDTFLDSASFNSSTNSIDFVFNTASGKSSFSVDISSLVDTYTNGNGLALSNKQFSIKLDSTSEGYLSVSANGIKISGITSAINAVQSDLNAHKTSSSSEINAIKTSISEITTKNTAQDTEISNLKSTVSGHTTSIDGINTNITNLEGDVDEINAAITDIEGDINTINTDIINIKTKNTEQDNSITNLENRITELENNSDVEHPVVQFKNDNLYNYFHLGETPTSELAYNYSSISYLTEQIAISTALANGSVVFINDIQIQLKSTSDNKNILIANRIVENIVYSYQFECYNTSVTSGTIYGYIFVNTITTGSSDSGTGEDYSDEIAALQTKDTEHDNAISTINNNITTINNNITTINNKNSSQDSSITNHESRITALESSGGSGNSSIDNVITIDAQQDTLVQQIFNEVTDITFPTGTTIGDRNYVNIGFVINDITISSNEVLSSIYDAFKNGNVVYLTNVGDGFNSDIYLYTLGFGNAESRTMNFYYTNWYSDLYIVQLYSVGSNLQVKIIRQPFLNGDGNTIHYDNNFEIDSTVGGTDLAALFKLTTDLTSSKEYDVTVTISPQILAILKGFLMGKNVYLDGYRLIPIYTNGSTWNFVNHIVYDSNTVVDTYYSGLPNVNYSSYDADRWPTGSFTLHIIRKVVNI